MGALGLEGDEEFWSGIFSLGGTTSFCLAGWIIGGCLKSTAGGKKRDQFIVNHHCFPIRIVGTIVVLFVHVHPF